MDLAQHQDQKVTPVAHIAQRQQIPQKFLEQILLVLKGAGIVASKRGKNGGYFLAMVPEKIKLSAIVQLTENERFSTTRKKETRWAHTETCPFNEVWRDINEYISEKLENLSIQDMCWRARELSGNPIQDYSI